MLLVPGLLLKRDHYHDKAIRTKCPILWSQYKVLRNLVTKEIKKAKEAYIESLLNENRGNPAALWGILKDVTNKKGDKNISLNVDGKNLSNAKDIVEYFNDYFIDSVNGIITNGETVSENISPPKNGTGDFESNLSEDEQFHLPIISESFVVKEIKSLSGKKATGYDELSVRLLKYICDIPIVIKSLVYIYNLSIQTNTFPGAWKIARVQPIPKTGDKCLVQNYRPISILPIVSKIIEKAVHSHFLQYLMKHNLSVWLPTATLV